MSDHTEWRVERREEPGWFGRLIAPQGHGPRPSTVAVLVGLLGVAAFVAAMVLDWMTLTIPTNWDGSAGGNTQTVNQSLVDPASMGIVFALAGTSLITMVGFVVTRPDQALRLRLGAVGLSVAMLSIAVSGTLNLQRRLTPMYYGLPSEMQDEITAAIQPGLFAGYAAAVLPAVAVWLASRPAARAARASTVTQSDAEPAEPTPPPARSVEPDAELLRLPPSGRAGSAGGLTVSASEPVDLSVTPDAWPR
jgi:hypothetical protein